MPAAKLFGEPSRLIQMFDIANMGIYFGIAKEKRKLLRLPLKLLQFYYQILSASTITLRVTVEGI